MVYVEENEERQGEENDALENIKRKVRGKKEKKKHRIVRAFIFGCVSAVVAFTVLGIVGVNTIKAYL